MDGGNAGRTSALQPSTYSSELEKVVGGAEHGPLGSDVLEPAQQELAKASCLLDLAEYRFHDLFPQAIATAMPSSFKHHGHGNHPRLTLQTSSGDFRFVAAAPPRGGT